VPARRLPHLLPAIAAPLEDLAPTLGRDLGHRGWRSGGLPTCRSWQKALLPGRIRQGPPCMRWRGPARPRRTGWPVAWPCRRRAPPAGARYPCQGPVSRLLPRSRGRPQAVPVSNGKTFQLDRPASRKSLRAAIPGSAAIHVGIHKKCLVIRISQLLSTGLFTVYPQSGDCEPENTGTAVTGCNRLTVLGRRVLTRAAGVDEAQMAWAYG